MENNKCAIEKTCSHDMISIEQTIRRRIICYIYQRI